METLLPLALFALVSTITPGPNNIMLTSSGILFGFMRSIPHMLGISFGLVVMVALCALGIGSLILAVPSIQVLLKLLASAYLLYLAWKLRRMSFRQDEGGRAKPMSFTGAALFQFANPKAWVMAVTAVSAFLPATQPVWKAVAIVCLMFVVIGLPSIALWTGMGAGLRRHLAEPKWQRLFCTAMVLLTIYSAAAIWM